jgi:hypothetical protein
MAVPDIVLLPHADLHMALNGAGPLNLRVMLREHHTPRDLSYQLTDRTADCAFDFFAPYQATGSRLANLPTVDPATGLVTATTPGIYLFHVRLDRHSLVARLQVHDTLLGWWFGSPSITVPVDPTFAHAQPSVYASFNQHISGTDPVGDITGHGYVTLTAPAGRVVVEANGRLRGTLEGSETVTGTFGGITHTLTARVVDYGKVRDELDVVRAKNVAAPDTSHNMIFIGEGFRDTDDDKALFKKIVCKTTDSLFSKSRHQPFGLLEKSFNVWKAYAVSTDHGVTCGFRLNETGVKPGPARGSPIPFEDTVKSKTNYTVQDLVRRVGLPRHNESRDRDALVGVWNNQSLDDFDDDLVDQPLVTAWLTQKTTGILASSDTLFGFRLGSRPGDRLSGRRGPALLPPAADNDADPRLAPFVKRLYEFFTFEDARVVLLDPRRNAIEVLGDPWNDASPGTPVMRYLSNLRARQAPHVHVGPVWVPDPTQSTFKPSVGLVAVILNEGLDGGSSVNATAMTAVSINTLGKTDFTLNTTQPERPMARTLPTSFEADIDEVIDTVAHEFGHSFNLGDEYEANGLDPNASSQTDFGFDNASRLGAIFHHGTPQADGTVTFTDDQIDPAKVKWLALLRMRVSSVLTKDSTGGGGRIVLTIDPRQTLDWAVLKEKNPNPTVMLRARTFPASNRQLPLSMAPTDVQTGLTLGDIDRKAGTIVVTGTGMPPVDSPVFLTGALLFSPLMAAANVPARIVERKVLDKLTATHTVLNVKTNNTRANKGADNPVEIADYGPPCKSHKVIGVYEGAVAFAGRTYRPAGLCKMRTQRENEAGDSAFCHVCKWLIVNRVDANLLALLDISQYRNAKRGGDG